jgi:outer membrane protein TolC
MRAHFCEAHAFFNKVMWLRLSIISIFLSFFGGCTPYVPQPLKPSEEINAVLSRLENPLIDKVDGSVTVQTSTWFPTVQEINFEDGLTLAEANTVALFYSPEIVKARAESKISKAQLLGAGLLSNPDLFAGPRFTNRKGNEIFPFSFTFPIPRPGELAAKVEKSKAAILVKKGELAAKELEVLIALREKFIALSVLEKKISTYSYLETVSREVVRWAATLYASGEIDPLSFHLAEVNKGNIETILKEQRVEKIKIAFDIQSVLGIVPSEKILFVDTALPLPESNEEFSHRQILHLPQVKAAYFVYQEAEVALKSEILKQYPSFSFGPQFESAAGQGSLGFGINLTLPIFNQNQGPIKEAAKRREFAKIYYQSILLDLLQKKEIARLEKKSLQEILDTLQKQTLSPAQASQKALQTRLTTGIANILEITTATRVLAEAKAKEAELKGELQKASLHFATASGEVFESDQIEKKNHKEIHETK